MVEQGEAHDQGTDDQTTHDPATDEATAEATASDDASADATAANDADPATADTGTDTAEPDTEKTDTAEPGTADAAAEETGAAASGAGTGRRPGRAVRIIAGTISVIGELLITAGIVLGLFVAYSLWWTNVLANQEAARDSDAVRELWEEPAEEGEPPPEYDPQEGIGFLHVPAMSKSEILVKEGIDLDILNGGVAGYYDEPVESAMPWDEEGNFSLAAHRDGYGAKFHNIHKLDEGDVIVFETRDTWYVYTVYATLPQTSRFNTAVLDPIPEESGRTEPGRYITLTTCTPIYSSTYRYIVWGELERTEEVDERRTPPVELRG